jgi:hypothetical protein
VTSSRACNACLLPCCVSTGAVWPHLSCAVATSVCILRQLWLLVKGELCRLDITLSSAFLSVTLFCIGFCTLYLSVGITCSKHITLSTEG